MKKSIIIIIAALHVFIVAAQITVNVPTAGTFSAALSAAGVSADTVTNLIVTGNIDARDIKFMSDSMPVLAVLNLEESSIYANKIPNNSFSNKTSLTSIKMPSNITAIGDFAFNGCSGLTGILTIPNSVTSIGKQVFDNCTGLSGNLVIPNSVKSIGDWAFFGCTGFTGDLTLPNSVIEIGKSAFYGCKGFNGNLTLPNSITSIKIATFNGCTGFTGNLKIPNSVTSIGEQAFVNCSGFTGDLIIPGLVIEIGKEAFFGCTGFNGNLTIPNSITSISENTFGGCNGFKGILTIPSSVTSIQNMAFMNCWGFTKIISANTLPPSITLSSFQNVNFSVCMLIVPVGSKTTYQTAGGWSSFTKITEAIFVIYNTLGGSAIADTIVNSGTTITAPVNPVRNGYDFAGWYKEAECINIWDFSSDLVTSNITLYAKWNTTYTVSFNIQGGSLIDNIAAVNNTTIFEPIPPVLTGYSLYGWYKEAECTNAWDFAADLVTANTTLYAKWIINSYSVIFDSQGGTPVSDIVTDYNTIISAPADPAKTDYTFAGWYKEAECTHAWNFATDVVTTDTILYAKWTSNGTNPPNSIETKNNTNPSLFPNPAIDFVKIEGEKLKSITIYNLLGETQMQISPEGEGTISMDVKDLKPGYYLVFIRTSNGNVSLSKLIKE